MRFRHLAIALVATSFLSAQAFADPLWQNLKSGMSIEDVRAAQPAAVKTLQPGELATGATNDLQLPNYKFGGLTFDVSFYFLDSQLVQVALTANGHRSVVDYQKIVTAMKTQHGPASSSGRTPIGYESRWQTAETNISVLYLSELNRLLKINYQARPAR